MRYKTQAHSPVTEIWPWTFITYIHYLYKSFSVVVISEFDGITDA